MSIPFIVAGIVFGTFVASYSGKPEGDPEVRPSEDPKYNSLCAQATQRFEDEFRGPLRTESDGEYLQTDLYLESDSRVLQSLIPAGQCRYSSSLWIRPKLNDSNLGNVGGGEPGSGPSQIFDANGCPVNELCQYHQTRDALTGDIVGESQIIDEVENGVTCEEIDNRGRYCGD